jgi:NAD(P)-dependent dehydrogenase (short-subunit alcohol dehydrogenase family)
MTTYNIQVERVGTPDDVVDVVKFLLKNKGFITGSDFVVDGWND